MVAALLVCVAGCDFTNVEPPEKAKPLRYETVDVALPACAIPLPPVRYDVSCGAAQIGKSIDAKDVCHLLTALQDSMTWPPREAPSVHADDWQRVRAVCVSRGVEFFPRKVAFAAAFISQVGSGRAESLSAHVRANIRAKRGVSSSSSLLGRDEER